MAAYQGQVSPSSSTGSLHKGKRGHSLTQSKNKLDKDGFSECFHKLVVSLHVSLAPCFNRDPFRGIKVQHLDPMLMTYSPIARGVVIAYADLHLSNKNIDEESDEQNGVAKIANSSPFSFLWVLISLLIWKPQIGDVMEGYIYMQTPSHIGLLVHDTFNASIKKFNIPDGWSFIPNQEDEYMEDNDGHSRFKSFGYWMDNTGARVEGRLRFTVKSIHTTGKVVSLEGTLLNPYSEKDAQPVTLPPEESSKSESTSRHKKFDDEVDIENITVTDIPEPKDDDFAQLPKYTDYASDDSENNAIEQNNSDSPDTE